MKKEHLPYLGFSHFYGIGPHHFQALLRHFRTAERAYYAPAAELASVVGPSLSDRFRLFRERTNLHDLAVAIAKKNITVLSSDDGRYPDALKMIPDPPICLYVRGNVNALHGGAAGMFAIVGTRIPTSYGAAIARRFAGALSEHGFTIVSGMALGIDAIAHWGALGEKGTTVAVLGCGVDIVYPPANRTLYDAILQEGGAVISEFPPGHTVRPGLFIVRNRLISGLSRGVLVVEGAGRSGTLTTAKYAAEQGKAVFAPPVPITSHLSQAPNMLLKQGAVLVTDIEDILQEFGIRKRKKVPIDLNALKEDEKRIVMVLQREDCTVDGLIAGLSLPLQTVLTALSGLEIRGIVIKDDFGGYRLGLA